MVVCNPQRHKSVIYIGLLAEDTQFSSKTLDKKVLHLIIAATNGIRPNIKGNDIVLHASTIIQMSGCSQLANTVANDNI